jgi:hypothetical protein
MSKDAEAQEGEDVKALSRPPLAVGPIAQKLIEAQPLNPFQVYELKIISRNEKRPV